MMAVDRTTDEYKQKVSDAEQRIEKRLAELNRSMTEEQSPKSIIGNSDGSMPVGTSSVIDEGIVSRAQSVALSGVKINKKFQTSKDLEKNIALFISNLDGNPHTRGNREVQEANAGISLKKFNKICISHIYYIYLYQNSANYGSNSNKEFPIESVKA